jgi:hypothetical protein
MAELEQIRGMEGSWQATSSLQVMPGEPVRDSHSRLQFKPAIKDKFVQINYDWEEEGKPQEGLLLVGYDKARELATAVWWDSWHMGEQYMSFQGSIDESGTVALRGTYPAPTGPDWGWRIVLRPAGDALQLRMYNATPDGQELWAVKADYSRAD